MISSQHKNARDSILNHHFVMIVLTVVLLTTIDVKSQQIGSDTLISKGNQTFFTVVENIAEFPGGQIAMVEFIASQIIYPEEAIKSGIEGTVYINFMVEPDGSLEEIKLLRGIGGGCDEEAIRVVESMPVWVPARQRGRAVRMSYNLPIRFFLPPDRNINNDIEEITMFPGGDKKLLEFLRINTQYPQDAADKGITGRVFVKFVVEKDGSLTNIEIERGIGYGCDEEAIRIIETMPNWIPGTKNGRVERSSITLPIMFGF